MSATRTPDRPVRDTTPPAWWCDQYDPPAVRPLTADTLLAVLAPLAAEVHAARHTAATTKERAA